jgi:hypothetical protein
MAPLSHLQQLNEAVLVERSEDELRQRRCDNFLEKIIRFQSGQGTLPAEIEFLQFREDLLHVAAFRSAVGTDATPAASSPVRMNGAKANMLSK